MSTIYGGLTVQSFSGNIYNIITDSTLTEGAKRISQYFRFTLSTKIAQESTSEFEAEISRLLKETYDGMLLWCALYY